jgi:hypothetical protein
MLEKTLIPDGLGDVVSEEEKKKTNYYCSLVIRSKFNLYYYHQNLVLE